MIWVQNIIISAIAIPFFFMIKDAPDKPPSLVALKEPENKNLMLTFKKVSKNRNYMLLLVIFELLTLFFALLLELESLLPVLLELLLGIFVHLDGLALVS